MNTLIARLSDLFKCVCGSAAPFCEWYSMRPLRSICKCWTSAWKEEGVRGPGRKKVSIKISFNAIAACEEGYIPILRLGSTFYLHTSLPRSLPFWLHLLAAKNCILSRAKLPCRQMKTRIAYCVGAMGGFWEMPSGFCQELSLRVWSICVHNLLIIKIVCFVCIPESYIPCTERKYFKF